MFFFERQNSSGGLRPPQQSMIQPLLLVMMICCISLIRIICIHLFLNTDSPQQSIIQTLLLIMKICIRLDAAEAGDLRYYIKNHPTLTDVRIGRTGDVLCFYLNVTKLQIDRIYFSFMLCAK